MKSCCELKLFLLALGMGFSLSTAYAQQIIPLNSCPNGGYVGPGQSCDGPTYRYLQPRWGAFALNIAKGGGAGKAQSTKSQQDANQMALDECNQRRGANCQIAMTFKNTCGALAWGDSHAGRGTGNTAQEAEQRALADCKRKGDNSCSVEVSGFCAGAKNW